jgi:DedD protein
MADTQDVDTLKRRGRRRLVGAIALVLLAVIVLPMVFDQGPKQTLTTVNIRIPREDEGAPLPKPAPPAPPAVPAESKGPETSGSDASKVDAGSRIPAAAAPEAQAKGEPSGTPPRQAALDAERAKAEAALANVEFVVPVAAFSGADRVKKLTSRLAAAKIPYYTEPVSTASGQVTRVRAGPFGNRQAADQAREKLKRLGLSPGNVAQRSE